MILYDYMNRLYSVEVITGIPSDVIVRAAKIYNAYGNKTGWNKCLNATECEKLISVLMAGPEKWDGIYLNPYTHNAIVRIERKYYN